jgi:hypothetical protein
MSIIDIYNPQISQMKGDGEDTVATIRASLLPGRLNYQSDDQRDWTGRIEGMPPSPPRTEPLRPSKATINHQQSAINSPPSTINSSMAIYWRQESVKSVDRSPNPGFPSPLNDQHSSINQIPALRPLQLLRRYLGVFMHTNQIFELLDFLENARTCLGRFR